MRFVLQCAAGQRFLAPETLAGEGPAFPIGRLSVFPKLPLHHDFDFSLDLQKFLQGKELLLDELPFPIEMLHRHYIHGYLSYRPGISHENGRFRCRRCGNGVQRLFASFSCARCRETTCTYCRKCIMMGRVSQCTPLIHWCGPQTTYSEKTHRLVWKGELSPEQKRASQTVGEAVGKGGELLIWAVCGAGKTEVLFEGIEKALTEGMNVCLASPRTDVITELAPRLREAFPDTGVIALYGGSKDRGKHAQLVLATTHQLFRYREAFDLVVIDEVDAFPFDSDKSLAHAVEKAKKPEASTVYLTATPDAEMKRRFLDKRMAGVKIPIRYHRRPLPVPVFRWIGHWKKALVRQKLPDAVRHWAVRQCESGRPAFLFVPSIDVMERVVRLLRHVDERIIGVYSGDGERREKVERFRRGEIPIIVTTTILERGVTVPNVDAAVFGADDDVFSERALVQMAGRVGRSAEAPDGDAVFFHYGKTKAMAAARRHIESMNREAFADKGR